MRSTRRRALLVPAAIMAVAASAAPTGAAVPGANGLISFLGPSPAGNSALFVSREGGSDRRLVAEFPGVSPNWPKWAPDGGSLVTWTSPPFDGNRYEIVRVGLDGSKRTLVSAAGGNQVADPDFAPDGKAIVFRSGNSTSSSLWLVAANGGTPTRLTPSISRRFDFDPTFTPDGRSLVFMRSDASGPKLMARDLVSRTERVVVAGFHNDLDVSPDGKTVLATRPVGRNNALARIDLASGAVRFLHEEDGLRSPSWAPDNRRVVYSVGARFPILHPSVIVGETDTNEQMEISPNDGRGYVEPDWQRLPAPSGVADTTVYESSSLLREVDPGGSQFVLGSAGDHRRTSLGGIADMVDAFRGRLDAACPNC